MKSTITHGIFLPQYTPFSFLRSPQFFFIPFHTSSAIHDFALHISFQPAYFFGDSSDSFAFGIICNHRHNLNRLFCNRFAIGVVTNRLVCIRGSFPNRIFCNYWIFPQPGNGRGRPLHLQCGCSKPSKFLQANNKPKNQEQNLIKKEGTY
ncbi:hypothetical protein Hdeb2414_s0007g00251591 [Helianthus debilis subsp. tardiflorus]